MRVSRLIALAVLSIAAAGFSARVVHAQTPKLECARLLEPLDDGAPLAAAPNAAAKSIEPSQVEAACRSALSSEPANPVILFQLGRALSVAGKGREAMKYYFEAADRGHVGAMNDLGGMFEYGVAVPKNSATALMWYERAAERGHVGAMIHLGQLSEIGEEVAQDYAEARRWYEKASALGNAAAMNQLADLFRYGRGVPADPSTAAE
jgi:TPR repeat protein